MRKIGRFYIYRYLALFIVLTCFGCSLGGGPGIQTGGGTNDWRGSLANEMPLFGHRNWILIVDKAFPMLNAPGIKVIYANEDLLAVLKYTLDKIDSSSHVRPIVFIDKELQYITSQQDAGVDSYRDSMKRVLHHQVLHTELHDSVFTHIKKTSDMFSVLVIKTNETLAYSSVYLQLDCAYWGAEKEGKLREAMR